MLAGMSLSEGQPIDEQGVYNLRGTVKSALLTLIASPIFATCGKIDAMDQNVSALERAFEIAKSGQVASLQEIKLALKRQGYPTTQLEGPLLAKQLRAMIKAARKDEIA
jgi:hypothetical protein